MQKRETKLACFKLACLETAKADALLCREQSNNQLKMIQSYCQSPNLYPRHYCLHHFPHRPAAHGSPLWLQPHRGVPLSREINETLPSPPQHPDSSRWLRSSVRDSRTKSVPHVGLGPTRESLQGPAFCPHVLRRLGACLVPDLPSNPDQAPHRHHRPHRPRSHFRQTPFRRWLRCLGAYGASQPSAATGTRSWSRESPMSKIGFCRRTSQALE